MAIKKRDYDNLLDERDALVRIKESYAEVLQEIADTAYVSLADQPAEGMLGYRLGQIEQLARTTLARNGE